MSTTEPAVDLVDPDQRERVAARLGSVLAGRPVVLGPGVLAVHTRTVRWLGRLGCPVLVLTTGRGAGPVPAPHEYTAVPVTLPRAASVTEEFRTLDRVVRTLPPVVVDAVEAFDPRAEGVWWPGPFVTSDEPLLGRPVLGGRPRAFLELEDKLLAEEIWAAAGVTAAPHRVVRLDDDPRDATSGPASGVGTGLDPGLDTGLDTGWGTVWSGDARDGFNGGGNYVRWVRDAADAAAARAFFLPRCDRVRVMPFLEGVPCSIHGFVLPDGTAALRPVEIATLREETTRRFVYGGVSSWWDPDPADREEMREVARRVGEQLRETSSYAGAFGVDGVLTADGFRPTELNTRMPAGLSTAGSVDLRFLSLLQLALLAGHDTGLTAADVESVVPLLDEHRSGQPVAVADGVVVGGEDAYDVVVLPDDRGRPVLRRAERETGDRLVLSDTPTGCFAKVDPCGTMRPGARLAPLNVALMEHLDREHGSDFGTLTAARDVRGSG